MQVTREIELQREIKRLQEKKEIPQEELDKLDQIIALLTMELNLILRKSTRKVVYVEERKKIIEGAFVIFFRKKKIYPMLTLDDMARFLRLFYCFAKRDGKDTELTYNTVLKYIKTMHSEWFLK